jgi:hypothetical protein
MNSIYFDVGIRTRGQDEFYVLSLLLKKTMCKPKYYKLVYIPEAYRGTQ